MSKILKNPLIVALDVDDERRALQIAEQVAPFVGALKVGPRLVLRNGPGTIKTLSKMAPIFLDHKFYDIPTVTEAAVQSAFDIGVTLVTVHASAGRETLERLASLEKNLQRERSFLVLAVTILTSVKAQTDREASEIQKRVDELATLSMASGLRGLVCSSHEVSRIKEKFPNGFFVTPGIRSASDVKGDQGRTMTASEALRQGSSAIVVGRPIIEASDPALAARKIFEEISNT